MEKLSQREKRGNSLTTKLPLVVILGPTSSGKSSLAVRLAKKYNGEIVSADSRQVYKELSIGTGKISKKEMRGIPHYLLDVASVKKKFDVAQYQSKALHAIQIIRAKGKLPFLVGGSALYLYAVADGMQFPSVTPNLALRKKLEKLNTEELFGKLKLLDPQRATTIEQHNPRRLIRALEIVLSTKNPVPLLRTQSPFSPLIFIGIRKSPPELKALIEKRIKKRLKKGWVMETKKLLASKVSETQIHEIGLGYQWILLYIKNKISKEEMLHHVLKTEVDFARRQMSWFKKDSRIHWIQKSKEAFKLLTSVHF